jgi:hypothetical protein
LKFFIVKSLNVMLERLLAVPLPGPLKNILLLPEPEPEMVTVPGLPGVLVNKNVPCTLAAVALIFRPVVFESV